MAMTKTNARVPAVFREGSARCEPPIPLAGNSLPMPFCRKRLPVSKTGDQHTPLSSESIFAATKQGKDEIWVVQRGILPSSHAQAGAKAFFVSTGSPPAE
mgnify:CR=1 FL=1